MVTMTVMDELLLYIRLEDDVVVDDGVTQIVGAVDKHALVTLIRNAVAEQLVERWALANEPVDLTGPIDVLDNRALGIRLTNRGRARVDALLDRAHEVGRGKDLDELTRSALDQPRVDYATVMSDLAES
jgi:hypothetical protein